MSASPTSPAEGAVPRRVLLGAGLAVTGALAGGAAGFAVTAQRRRAVPHPVPPADVLAAVDRERDLLARYDDAVGAAPTPLWAAVRAEHAQHLAALQALLPAGSSGLPGSPTGAASSTGGATGSAPAGAPRSGADLAAAETAAADAARAACLAGNGTTAVLLASIAASEATHAAVLG